MVSSLYFFFAKMYSWKKYRLDTIFEENIDLTPFFHYLLAGFLYIFSFPNFNLSWLAWFCLAPLIIAIDREKDIWSLIRNCFLMGWIIFLGGMYWLTKVTVLGWILVTFYMAWYIVLFGIIRFYNKDFITVPLAWTVLEFIRSNFLGGIPWLLLGASQYNFLPLIQISNITGIYGISFLVALVNIGILKRKSFCFLVLVLVFAYGKYNLTKQTAGEKIKIGIVQPNVPQDIKWDSGCTGWMVDKLEKLSKKINQADLIIWPETAVPTLAETSGLFSEIKLFTKELNTNLMLGSQGVSVDKKKDYYNSAFLISKDGELIGEYRKIHLVPFGEFVPFSNIFPFLKSLTPIQEGFTAGNEYKIFKCQVSGVKYQVEMSTLICFEDIFPSLARKFVQRGADVLVNITNDGWFRKTSAIYQHAYLSVFRAVENGVPLIRATNTGLSCFIEHTGRIRTVKPFMETAQVREILVPKRNTFYTKYGDVFSWFCIGILILKGGYDVRRIKKEFRAGQKKSG